jgi:quercetin dioxygenase-like cupin family protein
VHVRQRQEIQEVLRGVTVAAEILHVREDAPVSPPEQLGPYRIESLIPPEHEAACTAYRVWIAPHSTTSVSFHRVAEEIYYVLSGQGTAVLNGERHELRAGDFLRLPPGTTHGFITGAEALLMLDIHTPGSRPDRDVYFVGETPEGFAG